VIVIKWVKEKFALGAPGRRLMTILPAEHRTRSLYCESHRCSAGAQRFAQ
jgi:hypothetical protein